MECDKKFDDAAQEMAQQIKININYEFTVISELRRLMDEYDNDKVEFDRRYLTTRIPDLCYIYVGLRNSIQLQTQSLVSDHLKQFVDNKWDTELMSSSLPFKIIQNALTEDQIIERNLAVREIGKHEIYKKVMNDLILSKDNKSK